METVGQVLVRAVKNYQAGHLAEAQSLCHKILREHPEQVDTLFLCGVIAYQTNRWEESVRYYQKVLDINPNLAEIHSNMAAVQISLGNIDVALMHGQKAVSLKANYADGHENLANALRLSGRLEEAVVEYQKALSLQPNSAECHNGLAVTLKQLGKLEPAIVHFQKAIALNPNQAHIYNNLANALQRLGKYGEAIFNYQEALKLKPIYPEASSNLGGLLMRQGKIEEAISYKKLALNQTPHSSVYHSNLLLALNYQQNPDLTANFLQHQQWGKKHASAYLGKAKHYSNQIEPHRRLKIGYVSPDFRTHAVAYFIKPVLENHNHQQLEIFCYANVTAVDETTTQLQKLADHWRNIVGLNDQQVAALIENDQIDILVDLAGHTSEHRLLVFALKPAPIQITYLGYPNSTGLPTIDYRITDGYADPLGQTEQYYTEELIRLPHSFLCYQPGESPPLVTPPVLTLGYITFGSFNNLAKVNDQAIASWAKIVKAVPKSKLLLKYRGLGDTGTKEKLLHSLRQHDIPDENIVLLDRINSHQKHLETYNQVDIALDTFPYNGTTTTYEALWMGVPVITLAGINHVSRVGVSILSNVGLTELIADSPESYVNIAVGLANQPEKLQQWRANQRERMMRSPNLAPLTFTQSLEASYQQVWQKWCIINGAKPTSIRSS